MLNYPVILSHRRSTTLSLETYPLFQPPSRYNCGDLIHSGIPVVEVNQTSALPLHSLCDIKGGPATQDYRPEFAFYVCHPTGLPFFFFFSFLCEHYDRYGEHSGPYKLPTEMCSVEFKHYKEK